MEEEKFVMEQEAEMGGCMIEEEGEQDKQEGVGAT